MKSKHLFCSPLFVLLLSLFADFVFSGGFLFKGTLFGDNFRNFFHFRDLLDSISRFGIPAWWFPQYQNGFPGYFYSMLTVPSYLNPMFAIIALPIWVLGRLGVHFTQYQPIYVLYLGFLNPTLFVFAFWMFTRRLFKNPYCIGYATILAAFSPGVGFASMEVGWLEHTTYSLLFFTAVIDWIKDPNRRRYWAILFCIALLSVSLNIGFLYWNLFVIPFFLFLYRKPLLRRLQTLTWFQKALIPAIVLACFLPNLIAVTQGGELVRATLGETMQYPFEKLLPGSPAEFLTASLPGFGFDWLNQRKLIREIGNPSNVEYYYMGLLALPLLILGLVYGNRKLRYPLLLILSFYSLAACLESYSPFFGALQLLPTPLKSCNHFCDAVYRFGTFMLVILGATLGLQTLLRRKDTHRFFVACFTGTALTTIGIYVLFFQKMVFHSLQFTTFLAFFFFFSILLLFFFTEVKKKRMHLQFLLLLVLVDVGTFSFHWVRETWNERIPGRLDTRKAILINETVAPNGIGVFDAQEGGHAGNGIIVYKPYFRMRLLGYNAFELPRFHLFNSLYPSPSLQTEIDSIEKVGIVARGSLPFAQEDLSDPELRTFMISPETVPHQIAMLSESYNDFSVEVTTRKRGLFFIRDAHSPYWKAWIDNKPVKIHRGFYHFKVLILEPGKHQIRLSFWPTFIPESILVSYLIISLLGIFACGITFKLTLPVLSPFRRATGIVRG